MSRIETSGAALRGLALLVLAAVAGMLISAAPASAAEITPCVAKPAPTGPVVEKDGNATIELGNAARRKLRANGVRMSVGRPADNFTGRPSFPVGSVAYGESSSAIGLGGSIVLKGKKRKQLKFTGLSASVRASGASFVTARFGGGVKRLFVVRGGKVSRDVTAGTLYLNRGRATLTGPAAKFIKKRFGLKRLRALKKGMAWGPVSLYSLYRVTLPPEDPKAEVPEEPPVMTRPVGAVDLTGATVTWRIRESFIRYVSSGDGASAIDGSIPGAPEVVSGATPLVYNYSFPFTSGWTDDVSSTTLVKGSGGVAFRYCKNTINFQVTEPEIELNGDASRLIFRVHGTDGTAFPNSRAVMVGLKLSEAESVETAGNTTTYNKIPGFVPLESAGIFADFYMPGAEFGSVTLSITKP